MSGPVDMGPAGVTENSGRDVGLIPTTPIRVRGRR
jgi:hypothetical protein